MNNKNIALASINRSHLFMLAQEMDKHNKLKKFYIGYPNLLRKTSFQKNKIVKVHHIYQSLFKLRKFLFLEDKNNISEILAWKVAKNFDYWLTKELKKDSVRILISESTYSNNAGKYIKKNSGKYIVERPCSHVLWQENVLKDNADKFGQMIRLPTKESIETDLESYHNADKIIVPSKFVKKTFEDFGLKDKVKICPYTRGLLGGDLLDCDVIEKIKRQAFLKDNLNILFVGSASLRKGVHILLEACLKLDLPYKVNFVGSLTDFAKELMSIETGFNFQYIGRLKGYKLAEQYLNADVLVLPSIEEGYGMVIPEAMSYGTIPIVSSNVGASDLINDGFNGMIFKSNRPSELTEKLLKFSNLDIDKKILFVKNCLFSRTSQSWNGYFKKMMEIIKED